MTGPTKSGEHDGPHLHQLSIPKRAGRAQIQRAHRHLAVDSEDTIGQFSFGPATQTTVVTTTTTTTTRFPPFVIRASRNADRLNPKLYPLARVQTPASLRKIVFTHHGKQVIFREAADTTLALEETIQENVKLAKGHGFVQNVQKSELQTLTDAAEGSRPVSKSLSEQPASPTSIVDDEEDEHSADEDSPMPARPWRRVGKQAARRDRHLRAFARLQDVRGQDPLTPDTLTRLPRPSNQRLAHDPANASDTGLPILPSPDEDTLLVSTTTFAMSPVRRELQAADEHISRINPSRGVLSRHSVETTVPTPPIDREDGQSRAGSISSRTLSSIPSRLHVGDSPSTQEGNLPSPSLSPVTAAAHAHSSGYFNDIDSHTDPDLARSISGDEMDVSEVRSPGGYESPAATEGEEELDEAYPSSTFARSSIGNIPDMIDFFEGLPGDVKSYVIHQLLRRCPKTTLHVVAEAVNPALKCDFLTVLPLELGLNILSYLDVKSLCRAAQVSKKWRQMINSDEKAWKELFEADGFSLPEGELHTAISQGWGWQDPHGVDGYEKDIGAAAQIKSESVTPLSLAFTAQQHRAVPGVLRRSKRKAAATLTSCRNKQIKRQDDSREPSADTEVADWMSQLSPNEGPYNAANAAMMAVPDPKFPMPGLEGLHLYKSLYRRHHLIRRNWMHEDTKPRHIAFRAHDSHVVTCLQFDTDKILTGSDDNNINVYDTKTGALRQLLRGHEGGVWALQYEGNTLVSGSTDRSVRVWDIEQGIETQVFRGHTSTVRCLQIVMPEKVGETSEGKTIFMPKQPLIITGSRDSTLRVWRLPRAGDPSYIQAESDAESDDCPYFVRTLTGHQHSVRAIAAHADVLVSGSYDCTVRVWRISTGETVHRLQGHSAKVYSVVLDHARNRCISGSMDNLVKIWSLDTGSALYTLEGHSSLVGLLDLNCDRLVSAAADSTLRIWDPENGQCKATLSAHTGAITCFQHDGQKVISGSDRTLKMWNIKTGECMKDLLSDLSGVWQVKFNERRCVAAVQRDSMTYIEVLDFGASRDGVPESQRGRRTVVDAEGREVDPITTDAAFYE